MTEMNKDELVKYFNFEDVVYRDPSYEPYVILVGYEIWTTPEYERVGLTGEFAGYRSFMIPIESKNEAFDELDYSRMYWYEMGYFQEDTYGNKKYITEESWEHDDGLVVEPLYVERFWPGLTLNFYEPSQRLILYLRLLPKNDEWIDPYNDEVVIRRIKKEELIGETKHTLKKIEIKIDYLKDYLAARISGLFIAKYSSRAAIFGSSDQVPIQREYKDIPNGTWSFYSSIEHSVSARGIWAQAEIRQQFWIEPFLEPRREDAISRGEFVGGVLFTLSDGTRKEFDIEAGHKGDYFKLISFNPRVMDIFLNRPNFDYEDYSRETLGLKFPTGETLHVAINPSGQIQVWWGQLAKLSKKYQELLAPFSEPWLNKLIESHDYWRTTIEGEFSRTKPLKKALQELKTEINQYFLSKFGEAFFNKNSTIKDLKRVFEPYERDPYQLLDIMEQLDKWLFSEERPDKIIEYYRLGDEIENKEDLSKIKSLVSLRLLLKKYSGNEEAESKTEVLKIIKDLRICKAHYKDLSKTLKKYKLEDKSPGEIYSKLVTELEEFLNYLYMLCDTDFFA